jgi:hypothetical protein
MKAVRGVGRRAIASEKAYSFRPRNFLYAHIHSKKSFSVDDREVIACKRKLRRSFSRTDAKVAGSFDPREPGM